jgi:hypothetical protein
MARNDIINGRNMKNTKQTKSRVARFGKSAQGYVSVNGLNTPIKNEKGSSHK